MKFFEKPPIIEEFNRLLDIYEDVWLRNTQADILLLTIKRENRRRRWEWCRSVLRRLGIVR